MAPYLNFQDQMLILMMAYSRLSVVFHMLPMLGERIFSHLIIKNVITFLVIVGLWPCLSQASLPEQNSIFLLIKESIVGLTLAVTLCLPFWIAISLGEILDNQRGATISDSIDPVNGVQSTVLSGFFNFMFGAIFFAQNGMQLLMEVLVQSYRVFPQGSELAGFHWEETGHLLMVLVRCSIMLSAPILIVMMIAESLLAVFARYCPQLNPFSLSLTIKSSLSFAIFLFYGCHALSNTPLQLFSITSFEHFFS